MNVNIIYSYRNTHFELVGTKLLLRNIEQYDEVQ